MRRAIHTLRMRAGFLRKAPRGPSLDSQPTDETEIREHDRAADLLEALANPPETVEDLGKRAQDVFGLRIEASRADDDEGIWCAPEHDGGYAWEIEAPTVRAAWFAIVGMMGVGRGN